MSWPVYTDDYSLKRSNTLATSHVLRRLPLRLIPGRRSALRDKNSPSAASQMRRQYITVSRRYTAAAAAAIAFRIMAFGTSS